MKASGCRSWRRWQGARWWSPRWRRHYPRLAARPSSTTTPRPTRRMSHRCSRQRSTTGPCGRGWPRPPRLARRNSPGTGPPATSPRSSRSWSGQGGACPRAAVLAKPGPPHPLGDRLVDRPPGQTRRPVPAELSCPQDAPVAHPGGEIRVLDHPLEGLAPRLGIIRRHRHTRIGDHLGQARPVGHDDRSPTRHRLERRQTEALIPSRMRDNTGQVVDGGQLVRLDRIEVMQARAEARHLLPYLFVEPTPRSAEDEVRAVAHKNPGVEKRVEVLAGLDGADEQDETLGKLQPGPRLRSFLGAHGPEFLG